MRILVLLVILFLISSCKHSAVEDSSPCGKDLNNLHYKSDIKPIIKKHCLSCHAEYTFYDSLNTECLDGAFYKEVLYLRTMPPNGGLDTCDYMILKRWYYNGHTPY
jgi:hypothetical protein